MSKATYINVAGINKKSNATWLNVGGIWKKVKGWLNVGGIWKKISLDNFLIGISGTNLIGLDLQGNQLFSKTISAQFTSPFCVLADGNYIYVTGWNGAQLVIAKYDSSGNFISSLNLSGTYRLDLNQNFIYNYYSKGYEITIPALTTSTLVASSLDNSFTKFKVDTGDKLYFLYNDAIYIKNSNGTDIANINNYIKDFTHDDTNIYALQGYSGVGVYVYNKSGTRTNYRNSINTDGYSSSALIECNKNYICYTYKTLGGSNILTILNKSDLSTVKTLSGFIASNKNSNNIWIDLDNNIYVLTDDNYLYKFDINLNQIYSVSFASNLYPFIGRINSFPQNYV